MSDGNCELYSNVGYCYPHSYANGVGWGLAILIVLAWIAEVAQWRRNHRHPLPLELPPAIPDAMDPDQPIASTYVAARVRVLPAGPITGTIRRLAAVITGRSYPLTESKRGFLRSSAVVEIYEIATGHTLTSFRWTRNVPAAQRHAASLNERAATHSLPRFCGDLRIPVVSGYSTDPG